VSDIDLTTPEPRLAAFRGLTRQVAAVLRTAQVHPPETPALAEATDALGALVRTLVRRLGPLRITVVDGVHVNDEPVQGSSRSREPDLLTPLLRRRRFHGVEFARAPTPSELRSFLGIWRTWRSTEAGGESFNDALRAAGVRSVRAIVPNDRVDPIGEDPAHTFHDAMTAYCALLAVADELANPGNAGADLPRKTEAALHGVGAVVVASPDMLLPMTTHRDDTRYEAVHAANCAALAMLLARAAGLGPESIVDVGRGGLYCDLAMAMLVSDARHQAGALQRDVASRVRRHPMEGFVLSLTGDGLDEGVRARAIVAYEHHIGLDDKGYPGPAPAGRIHIFSRIVAVADGYDALCHDRGDRHGTPRPLILETLAKEAGGRYDPLLLQRFFSLMGRFPPGSVVRLNTGEIGIVARPARDPRMFDRPLVYLVREPRGGPLPTPVPVDLSRADRGRPAWIIEVLEERLVPDRLIPLLAR